MRKLSKLVFFLTLIEKFLKGYSKMQVEIFTLQYDYSISKINDKKFKDFCLENEIDHCQEKICEIDNIPTVILVVQYHPKKEIYNSTTIYIPVPTSQIDLPENKQSSCKKNIANTTASVTATNTTNKDKQSSYQQPISVKKVYSTQSKEAAETQLKQRPFPPNPKHKISKRKNRSVLVGIEMTSEDIDLYERLRNCRNTIANEHNHSCYIYGTNLQLAHIAKNRPKDINSLTKNFGLGKFAASILSNSFLEIIEHFLKKKNTSNSYSSCLGESLNDR